MDIKLTDAELRIMEILWRTGEERATYIADISRTENGWEKNTTYTFLQRLIKKGAVMRSDPGFFCKAIVEKSEVLSGQALDVVDRFYNGSIGLFVQSFLDSGAITPQEKERLRALIDRSDK